MKVTRICGHTQDVDETIISINGIEGYQIACQDCKDTASFYTTMYTTQWLAMKTGDKLQVVQDDEGKTILYFVAADNKTHKKFTLGDAAEALKYLLLDEVGRERIKTQ